MEPLFECHKRMIQTAAQDLVARAARLGVVLTIEQVAMPPLAMGNHTTVVSVRPDAPTRKKHAE